MLLNLQSTGQSLWMNSAAREILYDGSFIQHIEDWSVAGLFLDPLPMCQTMSRSNIYDSAISKKIEKGICGEQLVAELILEDARHAADLLRYVFEKTDGVDGWVVIPVSPLRKTDSEELRKAIIDLHSQLQRPNILINVPGFLDYSELIEELVFRGFPINISHICSHDQYINAAESYLRGIERRIDGGLNSAVTAFVSISISQLTTILSKEMAQETASLVAIAAARKIYKSMRILHTSEKWERAYNAGARILRLIWVNSADEQTSDSEYFLINNLIAPLTVTSISSTLLRNFPHCDQPQALMPENGGDCDEVLTRSEVTGLNFERIADTFQKESAECQIKTWITLLDMLARRSASSLQKK